MNDETENWKLNTIDVWTNCVRSRECRVCRFRESNFHFFSGGACPRTPYIIRAFGADNALVSPVTLVLNVQLQKTPFLDKMNYDTEKQWSKIYIILDENRSLNAKETIQNKTKAAVKRATKIRATCFATLLQTKLNSDVARFTTHVRPYLARNKDARFVFVGGKTSNITIQLILQPCCKTNCALFVPARFTVP